MREELTDLWTTPCDARCITTNGSIRKDGCAVMGRGVAQQAAVRYARHRLAVNFGRQILSGGNIVQVIARFPEEPVLVAFPVKAVWDRPAVLDLIAESAVQLMALVEAEGWRKVLLPRPGCGNGQRSWDREVRPLLRPLLDDRVTVITV